MHKHDLHGVDRQSVSPAQMKLGDYQLHNIFSPSCGERSAADEANDRRIAICVVNRSR